MTSRAVPRQRNSAFVDSAAFFALLNEYDRHHQEARQILERIADEHIGLLTTNFIVAETHALILSRHSQRAATEFLRDMSETNIPVLRAQANDEERAREIIFRYDDKRFSLTDAISFAVMERLGMQRAFTFDRNFNQYGFEVLQA